MTPKEKAEELVDKYTYKQVTCYGSADFDLMKDFALIAVDEIIKNYNEVINLWTIDDDNIISYWQEVKQEIEKL